mgnify:CR=1 FL=1
MLGIGRHNDPPIPPDRQPRQQRHAYQLMHQGRTGNDADRQFLIGDHSPNLVQAAAQLIVSSLAEAFGVEPAERTQGSQLDAHHQQRDARNQSEASAFQGM